MILAVLVFSQSCSTGDERKTREIMKIAVDYASGQVSTPERKTGQNGIMIVGNEEKCYIVDTAAIFTGLIDDDEKEDAIISVTSYQNRFLGPTEHLFIMNINNKLMMLKSFESDMKILSLKDRIITAEVPEHGRNSPLFYCPSCREVVRYKFINGDLVKVK
jgi:hypothetical protein